MDRCWKNWCFAGLQKVIQVLHQVIKDFDRQIQEAAEAHPDFFSLPFGKLRLGGVREIKTQSGEA
jgi:hypothetical protein